VIAFLRDGERDRFLAIFGYMKRSIALLAWKGRSLFWHGKGDRFFYKSRDRSI